MGRDIVSALIFARGSQIIQGMKKTPRRAKLSDCSHIPGGGVKEGESKEAALKREIGERETGVDVLRIWNYFD